MTVERGPGPGPSYEPHRTEEGWLAAVPRPSPEELGRFYAEEYYQQSVTTSYQQSYDAAELRHKELKVRQLLHAVSEGRGGAPPGRILDVGAGEGFVLAGAVAAGWTGHGIDHSVFGVERFNPQVAPLVRQGDAATELTAAADRGERYDACVLVNVLEHVLDPSLVLRLLRPLVDPDGVVVITVPNDDSPLQRRLRELGHVDRDAWFAPPQHLNYFNAVTGPAMLERHGLRIVDLYADFPIDWFLFHPAANYVRDSAQGRAAHRARIDIDLLLADAGIDRYHAFGRALAGCGGGRDLTMVGRLA